VQKFNFLILDETLNRIFALLRNLEYSLLIGVDLLVIRIGLHIW